MGEQNACPVLHTTLVEKSSPNDPEENSTL